MAGALLPIPRYRAVDSDGAPLAGAKLTTYAAGTSTPQATYSDSALGTPNANPVVADAGGLFGPIYFSAVSYKLLLTDADDVTIWSQDNVYDFAQIGTLGNITTGTITADGLIRANAGVAVDTISEDTPAAGVTVDGVLLKDSTALAPTAVVIGAASTSGVRLDLESGVLAVREGDDSAYASAKALTLESTTTTTVGTLLTVNGFGAHTFSAGGTGNNSLNLRNTTAGTANGVRMALGNDSSDSVGIIDAYSSTFSTANQQIANGVLLQGSLAGGLALAASNASGSIKFYANGSTLRATIAAGLQMGAPTGGDKGSGTINVATDVYKNNSAYANPDYVFEHAYTGQIERFKDNPGAAAYRGLLPLAELEAYVKTHLRFPQISDDPMGAFERADVALELIEQLALYLFEQARAIETLTARLDALENR